MGNPNQSTISMKKQTREDFDKKITSKLIEKYGNLTYNEVFLILISLSEEISNILPNNITLKQ